MHGEIWKGDILIADNEELESMDASETHLLRINAKEVLIPQKGEEFMFPIADGPAKSLGRDYEFREPTPRREQPERSEHLSGELQGESEQSLLKFWEFGISCEELSWNRRTSNPHRSETNGIAETAVRRIKEGTSAVLLQAGLDEKWRADSMECHCCLRDIQGLLSDGKTPYERRFDEPFEGPIIPFGSKVEYHPMSAKDMSRLHQFGKKVLPGIFLGHVLYAGEKLERRHYGRRH